MRAAEAAANDVRPALASAENLARPDGAGHPTALTRAAVAITAALTLASVFSTAIATCR
ncbi:hypothetical protein ACWGA9_27120 [Streptomyces sp. NPDC054950]|nr:hypothetical protein OV320_1689 [Actinobacteria bacterium OV320]